MLPYGEVNKKATFIDTTVHIQNGKHIVLGYQDYVGPYANLNAISGFIKIGSGGFIGDNSAIVSDPGSQAVNPTTSIMIGDNVYIGYNATVYGPSQIGGFGRNGKATEIGTGALIDGATIAPGEIVGALARVGPGVTVPGGLEVKPGVNITTDAEASDPTLGYVESIVLADQNTLGKLLANSKLLAQGYATLYQGQSATGVSPGVAVSPPDNGNLANVEGAGFEPLYTLAYSTSSGNLTTVQARHPRSERLGLNVCADELALVHRPSGKQLMAQIPAFPARVTGEANFKFRAKQAANHLGRGNSIAADQGQPINISAITQTGTGVTINSPLGGALTIDPGLQAARRRGDPRRRQQHFRHRRPGHHRRELGGLPVVARRRYGRRLPRLHLRLDPAGGHGCPQQRDHHQQQARGHRRVVTVAGSSGFFCWHFYWRPLISNQPPGSSTTGSALVSFRTRSAQAAASWTIGGNVL